MARLFRLRYLLIAFLILSTTHAAADSKFPENPCAALALVATPDLTKRDFLNLMPMDQLAAKLDSAQFVKLTNPQGETVVFSYGVGKWEAHWLKIYVDGKEAASLGMFPVNKGTEVYLKNAFTDENFRNQHAFETLIRLIPHFYPMADRMSASLAWTNIESVADTLAGRHLESWPEREKVLALNFQSHKDRLQNAVESSPVGKAMKNQGFVLSGQMEFISMERTEDKTPMLAVSWQKKQ